MQRPETSFSLTRPGAPALRDVLLKMVKGAILRDYAPPVYGTGASSAKVIHKAASKGFLINASCETVQEVIHAKGLGVDAVITSANPEKTIRELKDNGLRGVQCPAQLGQLTKLGQVTEAITCEKCGLCSLHREAVIIFEVHGRAHKRATKVITIKQQNSGK